MPDQVLSCSWRCGCVSHAELLNFRQLVFPDTFPEVSPPPFKPTTHRKTPGVQGPRVPQSRKSTAPWQGLYPLSSANSGFQMFSVLMTTSFSLYSFTSQVRRSSVHPFRVKNDQINTKIHSASRSGPQKRGRQSKDWGQVPGCIPSCPMPRECCNDPSEGKFIRLTQSFCRMLLST